MLHTTHSRLLTPIAAALVLALGSGGVAAAQTTTNQQYTNQQTTTSQQTTNNQQWKDNQQSGMNQEATANKSTDAFREGQLWATYVVNPALQTYNIKSNVEGSKVTLHGTVHEIRQAAGRHHCATGARCHHRQ